MRLLDSLFPKPHDPRPPTDAQLIGPRVMLRMGQSADWQRWRHLRGLSRDFLKPWEPEWPPDSLSRSFYEGMLRRHWREWRQGIAYGFLIFSRASDEPSPAARKRAAPSPAMRERGSQRGSLSRTAGEGGAQSRASARDWEGEGSSEAREKIKNPASGDGLLIGGIGLNDIRRGIGQKATLGYWIGQPYAGQGYMTEAANLVCDFAFKTLKLHRVEASCLPQNEPSKKLLQRLGFAEEGYAKSYLRIDGEWQDHVLWGKVGT